LFSLTLVAVDIYKTVV